MKCIVVILAVVSAACGASLPAELIHTAYGYLERFGVPQWEQMMAAAEQPTGRIVGGSAAVLGQFPYKAGLLMDIHGIQGNGVCGGSIISNNRVLTAAHCWFDGQHQAWRVTVVVGTIALLTGGARQTSNNVIMHENWNPYLASNDIAVIRLTTNIAMSVNIGTILLPTDSQLNEDFNGNFATVSGYGRTSDVGAFINLNLNHVSLQVISNEVCRGSFYPYNVVNYTNICTAGTGGRGICQGDSGGPLTLIRNGLPLLIGVSSFTHTAGCQAGYPSVYTRVTSHYTWIRGQM